MTIREVLPDGAALGDRFVARLGVPAGWIGVDELFGPAVIGAVGEARGTATTAVAATLLFEQYAQRLVAPVLAAWHRHGAVLDARSSQVRAQVVDGVVRRLAFADPPEPGGDADLLIARLVGGNLDPVADTLHRSTRAGVRVLRGTMANAVASALLHLSWPCRDRAEHVVDARAWLDRVPAWAGLVDVDAVRTAGESWMFVRRGTCCLAFRTTVNQARPQPCCSSCPVLPRSTTAELFGRATAAYAERHPH